MSTVLTRRVGNAGVGLAILRVVVGAIFIAHGGQKLFGLWGGPGLQGVVGMMGPIGYLVSIGEFFGGLGIICGVLSRFSAFWLIVIMLGAIFKVHLANGFFLGPKPGFEYALALIGLAAVILIAGPGNYAAINMLPRRHPLAE